jgi:hypothetical protein
LQWDWISKPGFRRLKGFLQKFLKPLFMGGFLLRSACGGEAISSNSVSIKPAFVILIIACCYAQFIILFS